ncbi:cysteine-rich CWC family protein [Leptospira bandrabouensis]|uniref:Cysteine-rich CWC family protein n=1 Tax=Leptospira bandrabouensis TaxID=2484903 RepID=A0A6H3NXG9_9LEPT|nr:cysteine-rich CWC family protein [Leptospira bandrabouensis]MCG6145602.1 cysteine-rich CWC family protein [Leptospira bandrabouensis]MCG6153373.1 cysteine-rich CWC family protein [Leptospira bandrabouensis]MCG6160857.1 cysteine-rich CWC family protein [Leptospira bandrabouensis]MCG6165396.1 cysteine-rich CWC family protein [Leptospira bandrabouensis]MCW7459595.1 cysteine-rich CWC family protein [Leptospira bandrabouensis]
MEDYNTKQLKNNNLVHSDGKHENKICPHCLRIFECKVGSISLCQCTKVNLSLEEREYLATQYADCLCYQCMETLAFEFRKGKSYKVTS